MKLEVGMYVRFKYPRYYVPIQISKIKSKEYDEDEKYYSYITDNDLVITEEQIIGEPSFNIIDVVQVGDYVNGNKIVHIQEEEFPNYPKRLLFTGVDENNVDDVWEVYNKDDIKSIVTKEQFESMEYKV